MAKYRPDLLHVHFVRQLLPVLGIPAALGIPLVVSMWGLDGFDAVDLNVVCREATVLHAVSRFVSELFRSKTKCERPIEVFGPEISYSEFNLDRQYSQKTPYRILTIARLHWMKGLLYGIHVAHELRRRGIPFVYDIVGQGGQRAELELAIRHFNLADVVTLHGKQDLEKLLGFLAGADVFLLPSVQETFGAVLLEAQAAGLPVVASRVGGVEEAVREFETAVLVEARDVLGMTDAVERLLLDCAQRRNMGLKGKEHARQFDWNIMGAKLLSMYEHALSLNEANRRVLRNCSGEM